MFSYRLKEACCCMQVRTGALVIATLGVMISVFTVVSFIMALEEPVELARGCQAYIHQFAGHGVIDGDEAEVAARLCYYYVGIYKFVLALIIGELLINGLLLVGLTKRKHTYCLPWLIVNASYLIIDAVALVIVVITFWATLPAQAGFFALLIGCLCLAPSFYLFKVVQTEWMNIKDLDQPQGRLHV